MIGRIGPWFSAQKFFLYMKEFFPYKNSFHAYSHIRYVNKHEIFPCHMRLTSVEGIHSERTMPMRKILLTTVTAIVVGLAGNAAHAWEDPALKAQPTTGCLKQWSNGAMIPCDEYARRMENLRSVPKMDSPRDNCIFYSNAVLPPRTGWTGC